MHALVRTTLDTYLRERRIVTLTDIKDLYSEADIASKDAIFVTLYYQGRVIASSGRITCKKENVVYECIDNTLLCLKDPRFTTEIQSLDTLSQIRIRTDRFSASDRRVLRSIEELDTTREGLIFLSQNLSVISVILPNMVRLSSAPGDFFALACKKAGLDPVSLNPSDYVLYAIVTKNESDFG